MAPDPIVNGYTVNFYICRFQRRSGSGEPLSGLGSPLSIMIHTVVEDTWKMHGSTQSRSISGRPSAAARVHHAWPTPADAHSGSQVPELRKFRTSSSRAANRARSPGLRSSAWMAEDDGAPMRGFRSAWQTVSGAGRSPRWK